MSDVHLLRPADACLGLGVLALAMTGTIAHAKWQSARALAAPTTRPSWDALTSLAGQRSALGTIAFAVKTVRLGNATDSPVRTARAGPCAEVVQVAIEATNDGPVAAKITPGAFLLEGVADAKPRQVFASGFGPGVLAPGASASYLVGFAGAAAPAPCMLRITGAGIVLADGTAPDWEDVRFSACP